MCAKCNNVVDNTCYQGDICPKCKSPEWAFPDGCNMEWDIIYKLQRDKFMLEGRNGLMKAALVKIRNSYGRPTEMMQTAKEVLDKLDYIDNKGWRKK
jgi:hypothetical protein